MTKQQTIFIISVFYRVGPQLHMSDVKQLHKTTAQITFGHISGWLKTLGYISYNSNCSKSNTMHAF